ncbi:TetR/AcrR family transcriptional regulator C-terminal domain-containing protein [Frankia sp. AgB1.9]|nr:TetR/AcrR family transcriptional regulator C-terminal domain-containing protein [Frankia sp. AgW1.1]MBL7551971.1 TetR/AcrR family transcriptional regulator C-terminal domain-containing protein [Frankia sp. AgB1.9]MBL7623259.1 TetR/AcrR family transcriptional regulator C-terminal domain-containing protein [Frankia sp. AgB1.8]
MPPAPASGRMGRPPRTSRVEIMAAARHLIDRDGWEKLTMRRLAAEAGTAPTTLYHHVRDKDDLLTQLLDDYADRMPRPAMPVDPRERVIAAATVIRDTLAAWPWVVEVLTRDDQVGRAALWMVETVLAGAVECGCSPEQAVDLYRSIWYYTAGEILIRANRGRGQPDTSRPGSRDDRIRAADAAELPHLAELADRWASLTSRDTYALGLRSLVDGFLQAL